MKALASKVEQDKRNQYQSAVTSLDEEKLISRVHFIEQNFILFY